MGSDGAANGLVEVVSELGAGAGAGAGADGAGLGAGAGAGSEPIGDAGVDGALGAAGALGAEELSGELEGVPDEADGEEADDDGEPALSACSSTL